MQKEIEEKGDLEGDLKGEKMHFSEADLQIIRQNPLEDFRSTYRQFFLEKTDLTVENVQERPDILKLILNDAITEESKLCIEYPDPSGFDRFYPESLTRPLPPDFRFPRALPCLPPPTISHRC